MTQYDNAYAHDNVYGHALRLVVRFRASRTGSDEAIHLDLGCGHGAIAEPLVEATGLTYVGVDASQEAVDAVTARGLEAHRVVLGGEDETLRSLRAVIAGRPVASISMLNTLEHLVERAGVLRAVRSLVVDNVCPLVISVPNVSHRDVAFKLVMGRWDYTETGILDTTHTRFFTAASLERELASCGLLPVARDAVEMEDSDQHFPAGHPALARGTVLHNALRGLRDSAPDASVNEFVWALVSGPSVDDEPFVVGPEPAVERPFLSVVMRTQGRRLHSLREALTALSGQTDRDFEVLVVGHRLDLDQQIAVERAIEDTPASLRERIRYVKVERGNRVAPLNEGFDVAQGSYIAILDDDDLPFAHWVETFHALAPSAGGKVLRSVAVRQQVELAHVDGQAAVRATSGLEKLYPSEFDFLEHLRSNHTPNMAFAFPRGVFHDFGLRFDDELTTTEDWDFILRATEICGVASSPEVTCVYNWWTRAESSSTIHPPREWEGNATRIVGKLDQRPVLVPPGSVTQIREMYRKIDVQHGDIVGLLHSYQNLYRDYEQLRNHVGGFHAGRATHDELLGEIASILESRSWRISAALRAPAVLMGRGRVRMSKFVGLDVPQLREEIVALRASRSWRATRVLRSRR